MPVPVDTCCLCLEVRPLTFEHVPPRAAFNDRPVLNAELDRLRSGDLLAALRDPKGTENQRGAGRHSLCAQCNSVTGHWYGQAYIDLVQATMGPFFAARAGDAIQFNANIRAFRVLKQILVMFCSACGPGLARTHEGLTRFLLNRESRELPPGLDVYLGIVDRRSLASRQLGISGRVDFETGENLTYAEIAFPPLDIILTLDSGRPDPRLMDVTWFKDDGVDERRVLTLLLHCLQVNTYLPADYSTADQLEAISRARGNRGT